MATKRRTPPERSKDKAEVDEAYTHLIVRGYTLTDNGNWLPPANGIEPTKRDVEAALTLGHMADYGGIVRVARCPFCGGRADPRSPIGVECMDCGGNAPDIETWQKRAP